MDSINLTDSVIRTATFVSAEDAALVIRILGRVGDRVQPDSALARCIHFAKEATWAAAYPDDPFGMLHSVAASAKNSIE